MDFPMGVIATICVGCVFVFGLHCGSDLIIEHVVACHKQNISVETCAKLHKWEIE